MIQSTKTEFDSEDKCLSEIRRLRLLQQRSTLQPEVIPKELARSNQWVVWTYKVRKQENGMFAVTKQPYQSKNPKWEVAKYCASDWSDLTTALRCLRENSDFDGIGYMFAEGDGLIGVDFDNCRDHFTGIIRPEFQFWINKFSSYTEISPSGTGVKVWIKGSVADNYFKYAESTGFRILNFAGGEIEIYRSGQYFTVTTQTLNGINSIRDAQAELDVICEFSLSRTQRDFRYSSCPDYQLAEQEENIERSILKTYDDLINLTYIYEPGIQHNLMKETATDVLDANLPSMNNDRFGKSKCNNCDENSHGYELCRKCYAAACPEEEVEDAVCEYFSKLLEFSVVRQPNHEITFGSKKMIPDVVLLDSEKNLVAIAECKREGITYNGIEQLKSYLSASDTQFGIFANSIEPDAWTFYENLRRHRFEENIPRSRFEAEIVKDQHVESIREEKSRLERKISELYEEHRKNEWNIKFSKQRHDELKNKIVDENNRLTNLKVDNEKLINKNDNLTIEIDKNEKHLLETSKLISTRDSLRVESSKLRKRKDQLRNDSNTLRQQRKDLREEVNKLTSQKSAFEGELKQLKNFKAIKIELKNEIDDRRGELNKLCRAIKDTRRLSRLDELEERVEILSKESIGRQFEEEFERLDEVISEIVCQKQLMQENQQKYAAIERNKVIINQKKQQLVQISIEREEILKQLRGAVNRLNETEFVHKSEIERHRIQLVKGIREIKGNYIHLFNEIQQMQEEISILELEINVKEPLFFTTNKDILPIYLQIEKAIDKLKTEKYELEAEIGHKIFEIIPKKIEISTLKSKEN